MQVPLIKADLPPYSEVAPYFEEALNSGRITNFGQLVQRFEAQVSERFGGVQAVTTSSGTVALLLALQALDIGHGIRVIIPSYTFTATAQAVVYAGGIPVFAEVRDDLTIDPQDVAALLEQYPDVGAVIGVHVHGVPCQVHELARVVAAASEARGRRIALLYDAAHAFGAEYAGQPIGTFGDAEIFSTSITKALVCGEGGIVTTRDAALAQRLRAMRNYGVASHYNATELGLNGKMSEFHAAIGCVNIERLDDVLATRQRKARPYIDMLVNETGVEVPVIPADAKPTWKDLTTLLPEQLAPHRDAIRRELQDLGVETRAYFSPAVHEQTRFARYACRALPVIESASRRVLTLPFFTTISDEQMHHVSAQLKTVLGRYTRFA